MPDWLLDAQELLGLASLAIQAEVEFMPYIEKAKAVLTSTTPVSDAERASRNADEVNLMAIIDKAAQADA